MRFTKRVINGILCTILVSIYCPPVNAASIDVYDSRFINNPEIIDCIKNRVNFKDKYFLSLWDINRKGENCKGLEVDTEHLLYTVQLSSEKTVDEIFISAPIIDNSCDNKMVGTILLSAQYGDQKVNLSDVLKDFCLNESLPQRLNLAEANDVQYFLNTPDAPTELPVEYEKIESLSAFEEKKEELETITVVVADQDKKPLGTGLSNIGKVSLVNIVSDDFMNISSDETEKWM